MSTGFLQRTCPRKPQQRTGALMIPLPRAFLWMSNRQHFAGKVRATALRAQSDAGGQASYRALSCGSVNGRHSQISDEIASEGIEAQRHIVQVTVSDAAIAQIPDTQVEEKQVDVSSCAVLVSELEGVLKASHRIQASSPSSSLSLQQQRRHTGRDLHAARWQLY